MRLARSRIAMIAALGAVIIVGLILTLTGRPQPVASTPTGSPAVGTAVVAASPSATPTSRSTPGTSVAPSDPPQTGTCDLPEQLPKPVEPVAAPVVKAGDLAMLFTSFLYERSEDGSLVAMDRPEVSWEVGLWFVPSVSSEARLLLAPTGGMVLPLALSADGAQAIVWWLPERRNVVQPVCTSGIYLISTSGGASELIIGGDWSLTPEEADDPNIVATWYDLSLDPFTRRDYLIPEAAFSSTGGYVSLVHGAEISIYGQGPVHLRYEHTGECQAWAWSATGAMFVAGCEEMTSAWLVRVGGGYQPDSIPILTPKHEDLPGGWEVVYAATIGLTLDRQIRVARFYGFPTGCETADCFIPEPAWSVTTLNPRTGEAVHAHAKTDFLVDVDGVNWDTHMAPDASWAYAELYEPGAAVIDFGLGQDRRASRIRVPAGMSGSVLFGQRLDEERHRVVVSSLDRFGTARVVATIRWPDGVRTAFPIIATPNLMVASPSR